jgi:hypothetical protein
MWCIHLQAHVHSKLWYRVGGSTPEGLALVRGKGVCHLLLGRHVGARARRVSSGGACGLRVPRKRLQRRLLHRAPCHAPLPPPRSVPATRSPCSL